MNSYAKKYENNPTQPKVNNKDLRWSQQLPKVDDGLNKKTLEQMVRSRSSV